MYKISSKHYINDSEEKSTEYLSIWSWTRGIQFTTEAVSQIGGFFFLADYHFILSVVQGIIHLVM